MNRSPFMWLAMPITSGWLVLPKRNVNVSSVVFSSIILCILDTKGQVQSTREMFRSFFADFIFSSISFFTPWARMTNAMLFSSESKILSISSSSRATTPRDLNFSVISGLCMSVPTVYIFFRLYFLSFLRRSKRRVRLRNRIPHISRRLFPWYFLLCFYFLSFSGQSDIMCSAIISLALSNS